MRTYKRSIVSSIILAALCILTVACNNKQNQTIKAPDQLISLEQAKVMTRMYDKHRISIIKPYEDTVRVKGSNFRPTENGWFTVTFLENYFNYINHYASLANIKISGYKVAFGNYPETNNFPSGEIVNYPRQNTFIIYPTVREGDKEYGIQFRKTPKGVVPLRFVDMPSTPGDPIPRHEVIPTIANEAHLTPPPYTDGPGEFGDPPGIPKGSYGG